MVWRDTEVRAKMGRPTVLALHVVHIVGPTLGATRVIHNRRGFDGNRAVKFFLGPRGLSWDGHTVAARCARA